MCESHGQLKGEDQPMMDAAIVGVLEPPVVEVPSLDAPTESAEESLRDLPALTTGLGETRQEVGDQLTTALPPSEKKPEDPRIKEGRNRTKAKAKASQRAKKVVVEEPVAEPDWDELVAKHNGDEAAAAQEMADFYENASDVRTMHPAEVLLNEFCADEADSLPKGKGKRAVKARLVYAIKGLNLLASELDMGTLHLDEKRSSQSAVDVAVTKVLAKMDELGIKPAHLPAFMKREEG